PVPFAVRTAERALQRKLRERAGLSGKPGLLRTSALHREPRVRDRAAWREDLGPRYLGRGRATRAGPRQREGRLSGAGGAARAAPLLTRAAPRRSGARHPRSPAPR